MYAHITKMAFKLDSLDLPAVQATVSRPDDSIIHSVEVDFAAEGACQLADRLWALF